jgi:hypothetical protein
MNLDVKKIAFEMLEAMKVAVGDHIEDVRNLANDELEDFAKRTAVLAEKVALGQITSDQARAILKIRRNAVETVLLAITGIGIISAQDAINAAIGVLKKAINSAIPGVDIL